MKITQELIYKVQIGDPITDEELGALIPWFQELDGSA